MDFSLMRIVHLLSILNFQCRHSPPQDKILTSQITKVVFQGTYSPILQNNKDREHQEAGKQEGIGYKNQVKFSWVSILILTLVLQNKLNWYDEYKAFLHYYMAHTPMGFIWVAKLGPPNMNLSNCTSNTHTPLIQPSYLPISYVLIIPQQYA